MKSLQLLLVLGVGLWQAAWAQPVYIEKMEWSHPVASDGHRIVARVILTAPAPAGGVKIIFEPTFKLNMPTIVVVPAGLDYVDFPVKITDNRFVGRDMTGTTVTAIISGHIWEGPGPAVGGD